MEGELEVELLDGRVETVGGQMLVLSVYSDEGAGTTDACK